MNTVGLGYEFVETTKARRRLEKAFEDEERLARVRKVLQDEKEMMDEIFENFNVEETLIETLVRVCSGSIRCLKKWLPNTYFANILDGDETHSTLVS